MKIGPKMAFILRVYQMTDAENAEDVERDREMVAAGLMSQREYDKRMPTRDVARRIRQRDNTSIYRGPKVAQLLAPICRKAKPSIERESSDHDPETRKLHPGRATALHPSTRSRKQALPDAARR